MKSEPFIWGKYCHNEKTFIAFNQGIIPAMATTGLCFEFSSRCVSLASVELGYRITNPLNKITHVMALS
jgi:hypothetical protein